MSGHSPEAVKKQIKSYVFVFVALAVLTVITVGVSYLHLPIGPAVALALVIASIKVSLVMSVFMHLFSERKIIWYILLAAVATFPLLLLVPSWHHL
jgi:cytochrome c oxidase subunit IV